ncbi:hypothetical protein FB45DRAFT_1036639 [Roridomyces roridus]|uniref:Uncharacterized protein n=1 Tax=Roridomyces roridus TaxID=1738132 RepID=A0AAD7B7L4_9AGAR|nr:hypothetical protein FB45DRAFT_1036639 [Roridomyces roridus]
MRFVIAFFESYWGQWEDGARGSPTFWTRAEEFIARKKRGEVDESRYWMDDDSYKESRSVTEAQV